MADKGIRRQIAKCMRRVSQDISDNSVGKFGRGLATEGYAGGYRQALNDVLLLLNGVTPNSRYWNGCSEAVDRGGK